ncbi:hypothetical protein GCM10027276_30300 [Comamonas piscis]
MPNIAAANTAKLAQSSKRPLWGCSKGWKGDAVCMGMREDGRNIPAHLREGGHDLMAQSHIGGWADRRQRRGIGWMFAESINSVSGFCF